MDRLVLPHGDVVLPAFFPDGTKGVVRCVDAADLNACGVNGIVMNALTVVGHQSSPDLWGQTVKLVETGRIDVGRMVTGRFSLTEAPRALDVARDEAAGSIKVMLEI